jgi:hypothetical protein
MTIRIVGYFENCGSVEFRVGNGEPAEVLGMRASP